MKDTVNLNDLRRMRESFNLGHDVGRTSARVHVQPSVVAQWFETFRKQSGAPAAPAPTPAVVEEPEKQPRKMRRV